MSTFYSMYYCFLFGVLIAISMSSLFGCALPRISILKSWYTRKGAPVYFMSYLDHLSIQYTGAVFLVYRFSQVDIRGMAPNLSVYVCKHFMYSEIIDCYFQIHTFSSYKFSENNSTETISILYETYLYSAYFLPYMVYFHWKAVKWGKFLCVFGNNRHFRQEKKY